MSLLAHVLGLDDASGAWYLWWSGACGQLSLVGAAFVVVRRHQCHTRWCVRLGHHPLDGTPYRMCRRHHPDLPTRAPTRSDVAAMTDRSDSL